MPKAATSVATIAIANNRHQANIILLGGQRERFVLSFFLPIRVVLFAHKATTPPTEYVHD